MLTTSSNTSNWDTVGGNCSYIHVQPCFTCGNNPCTCYNYTYYPQPYYGGTITWPTYPDMSGIEEKLDKIIKLLDPENKLDKLNEMEKEIDKRAWAEAARIVEGRLKEVVADLKKFGY